MVKRTYFLFLFLTLVTLTGFFSIKQLSIDSLSTELLYRVSNSEDASYLANQFDLELISVSSRNLATFKINNDSRLQDALEFGFVFNSESNAVGPPWGGGGNSDEDPFLSDQYALDMLSLFEAWELTEGIAEVTIAIIDTGIDINHEEFVDRISPLSYNSVTEMVGIEHVDDDQGHGTSVAGVIGATKDNGKGIAGVMQHTELMIIKANEDGKNTFKDSAIIEGIYYAVDNGANVINLSLGGSYANPLTNDALAYAKNNGVVVIAAAGNEGNDDLFYPAAFDSTISVSSIDSDYSRSSFSNYGETIDIAAPGSNILTTAKNNQYLYTGGTSLAAPYVAGIVGLMMSYNQTWDYDELIFRLLNSTVNIGMEVEFGNGLVNAYQALTYDFYTVDFETFDADSIESQIVAGGQLIQSVDDPTLNNYIFEGWYLDDAFNYPFNPFNDVVTEDITLYARFEPAYHTITFITEGSEVDSKLVARGDTFTLPNTSLTGHTFDGWSVDPEDPVWYEPEPVYSDLTLYAYFTEIIYHNVSIYFEDELIDTITVKDGNTLELEPIARDGYTFNGYYYDETFTELFDDSHPIYDDTTLYVYLAQNQFTVTFITDGDEVDPVVVNYGDTPDLPKPTKQGYQFVDWYIDDEFTTRYYEEPLYDDLVLYARFAEAVYTVTYIIDDTIVYTQTIEAGESLDIYEPSKSGYDFLGWYFDDTFTSPYLSQEVEENITLYGQFDQLEYTIRFYDADNNLIDTVLYRTDETFLIPSPPTKASTISFSYEFSHWSENLDNITEDLHVYPIYIKTFRTDSVQLNPGLDTIYIGDEWIDNGIEMLDPSLSVNVIVTMENDEAGTYTIVYQIHDEDAIYYELVRKVTVLEYDLDIVISLNRGISTIVVGGIYTEPGATSNMGTIDIIGMVDTSTAGVTKIIYRVEYQGQVVERVRYVHVIEDQTTTHLAPVYAKKEDELYA